MKKIKGIAVLLLIMVSVVNFIPDITIQKPDDIGIILYSDEDGPNG